MTLHEQWEDRSNSFKSEDQSSEYWKKYFEVEKDAYQKILTEKLDTIEGNLTETAAIFGMQAVTFVGFIDGINTSLKEKLELKDLADDFQIKLQIDFEKLFWNMLEAKADWLYTLEEWDDILTTEKRAQIKKEFNISKTAVSTKIERNSPCPCGSGKKYKKCCGINNG